MHEEAPSGKKIDLNELKEKIQKGEIPVQLNKAIEVTVDGKITLDGREIGKVKGPEDMALTN